MKMERNEGAIIKRVESQVRQQLFGMLALAVAGLMIINSFGLVHADADQTNLTFNVAAGSFTITNAPTEMKFPAQTYGVGNNIVGNEEIDGVDVTDYRGNSASWSVAVNANDLSDGTNSIPADRLTVYQDTRGYLTNVENHTTTYVAIGSNGSLNDAGQTLINGSTQASGIVQFDNGFVNLQFYSTDNAGDYGAIIVYTLS